MTGLQRRRIVAQLAAGLVLAAAAFTGGGFAGRALWRVWSARHGPASTIRFVRNPLPAPRVEIVTLAGEHLFTGDFKGRVTILNFWASWCRPCLEEMAALAELQREYGDHVLVLGLSVDDLPEAELRRIVESRGVTYPIALADDALQERFGGIEAVPTSFVLDADGRIVQKHVGAWPRLVYELEIRALAGLPVNAIVERFDDTGEVHFAADAQLARVPGVSLADLTPAQRVEALERLNTDACPCGCRLTLARCRRTDPTCDTSLPAALELVARIRQGAHPVGVGSGSAEVPTREEFVAERGYQNESGRRSAAPHRFPEQ